MEELEKRSKYFKTIDLNEIKGRGSIDSDNQSLAPRQCGWFDAVWCQANDSCGSVDTVCIPGGPQGSGHDGCCSGSWDHLGDGRQKGCYLLDMYTKM